MIDELLTVLRYKSEGSDIDFKSAQYRFNSGKEDDKAEMLKDILAMANSWREGPSYILIGFKEQRPHPAEVVGIAAHIDDANIQQFVHGKVKPKLTFSYEEHLYEGKTVGIITIPKQNRPFYLSHEYGKLKSNIVYVRRGSSTVEADPPEIIAMAATDAGKPKMRVGLSVLAPDNRDLPAEFAHRYLQITERLPDYKSPQLPGIFFSHMLSQDNQNFWREYAEYLRVQKSLILIQFILHNHSEVSLSNSKLEVSVEPLSGQRCKILVGADLPNEPKESQTIPIAVIPKFVDRQNRRLSIDETDQIPICRISFGSLLPGEDCRSTDMLAIIPEGPGRLRLCFRILASELPVPLESERILETTGEFEQLTYENLNLTFAKG